MAGVVLLRLAVLLLWELAGLLVWSWLQVERVTWWKETHLLACASSLARRQMEGLDCLGVVGELGLRLLSYASLEDFLRALICSPCH